MIYVKMTQLIYDTLRADLCRSHPFAHERVGFLLARKEISGDNLTIFATNYYPIPDSHYIDDQDVGARIGSPAIRGIMEQAYSAKDCIIHVHLHDHKGPPQFSKVDRIGYNQMIPSFLNIGGSAVHGAMVFSLDNAIGLIWSNKGQEPAYVTKLSIVGFPHEIQKLGTGSYV